MRVRGPEIPLDPDPEYLRLPALAPDADPDTADAYAAELCAEACDREVVHVVFLGEAGEQLSPAGRLHNAPRLPRAAELDQFVDMLRHQGLRVRARQVVLVWQTPDDDITDRLGVETWALGLLDRMTGGPLALRALWHRTPEGYFALVDSGLEFTTRPEPRTSR
ncbi:hypothetical protein [Frigoribacterium sp. CFBP 13712]|uniref:hypothetical protein n=1 Tax=Frigoribacterium sp. CFBP 13712 TaxID=2775309 RepID=UPI00177BCE2E|nr:hypothetical protein [Frigoribacterium sp. CFBP 13712]MBD8703622.1 hypothetical protein [Frigoribacterium sp. CFBP 13712]